MSESAKSDLLSAGHRVEEGRNLVVCCDGTSNEPAPTGAGVGSTNVVHLFRALSKGEKQIVYYDPGVGTSGILDLWRRRSNRIRALAEQATGDGLDEHVISAYRFLCEHYRAGDRISLFGFSRGAYAARVVAGVIHQVGLLRPEQANLAAFAVKAYKMSSDQDNLAIGWRFARDVGTRRVLIHFLGLWDTVGSMIAPLRDRLAIGLVHLPYTRRNPSVACVRHAMAIDERRRMFRVNLWHPGPFVPNPFDPQKTVAQDVAQVWFAGAHGDIGGGHAEAESGLCKVSLRWMVGEAAAAGLSFNKKMLKNIVEGQKNARGEVVYAPEDPLGPLHPEPTGPWWLLEYFPKSVKYREWPERKTLGGWYLPAGEPRVLGDTAWIHESVVTRAAQGYAPVNLGADITRYQVARTLPLPPPRNMGEGEAGDSQPSPSFLIDS
ncbi:DUF2235 domain-containing protein [Pararhodospirillum photometricum]|nr:DUF2235 domain-containing protein [Pararhodospirillum photometricum]